MTYFISWNHVLRKANKEHSYIDLTLYTSPFSVAKQLKEVILAYRQLGVVENVSSPIMDNFFHCTDFTPILLTRHQNTMINLPSQSVSSNKSLSLNSSLTIFFISTMVESSMLINVGHKRHRTKTYKTKNTTQKTKKMINTDPIKKTRSKPRSSRRLTPAMLLIY